MTKRWYISKIEVVGARGKPPVKWEGRVLKYVRIRRVKELEHARKECKNKNKWKLFCRDHPLVGVARNRCQIYRLIYRQIKKKILLQLLYF